MCSRLIHSYRRFFFVLQAVSVSLRVLLSHVPLLSLSFPQIFSFPLCNRFIFQSNIFRFSFLSFSYFKYVFALPLAVPSRLRSAQRIRILRVGIPDSFPPLNPDIPRFLFRNSRTWKCGNAATALYEFRELGNPRSRSARIVDMHSLMRIVKISLMSRRKTVWHMAGWHT